MNTISFRYTPIRTQHLMKSTFSAKPQRPPTNQDSEGSAVYKTDETGGPVTIYYRKPDVFHHDGRLKKPDEFRDGNDNPDVSDETPESQS